MRNTKKQIQLLTLLSMLTAAALILSYAESVLPPVFPTVPGIKIGLPNIITVFVLYRMGISPAFLLSILRISLAALLFGNPISFVYSLAGSILSISIMVLLKRIDAVSAVGVSVAGGIFHNVGQILAAMLILGTAKIGYYLVILAVTGTLSGLFVGLCGALMISRFPQM